MNKIAILHQGFIPAYRVRFYERLASQSKDRYVVFYGSPSGNEGHRAFNGSPTFPNVKIRNYEFKLFNVVITFQPLIFKVLLGPFDAVILGHELKYISNLILFFLCKLTGKTVLWWGYGFHIDRRMFHSIGYFAPIVARIKNFLARSADMYLVYTEGGAKRLIESGVTPANVTPLRNTIDMTELICLHTKYQTVDTAQIRHRYQLQPDSVVLLYVGRLIKEKRIHELLEAVICINCAKLCSRSVETVVIGAGPEFPRLQEIAKKTSSIRLLGRIDDEDVVAQFMRISAAFVVPGKVGLGVNYAFAHGRPVVTRKHDYQSPEVEYIVPQRNGLIVDGDFTTFVQSLAAYADSTETQEILSKGALHARSTLSLDSMVTSFDSATNHAINRNRRNATTLDSVSKK